jgi:DNA repair photolyase
MDVIYKPKGKAKEYAKAALNIYMGCTHGCTYCYAPAMMFKQKHEYFDNPDPRKDVVQRAARDARKWAKMDNPPEIMLCFIGDPYQPAESHKGLTRKIIKHLIENGLSFSILTKGGRRARRDFDLLSGYPRCRFGTSLSFFSQRTADRFEPHAAVVSDRIDTISHAKSMGIKTWVSLEPVIIPDEALRLVHMLHDIVDFWAVGKINHNAELEAGVDWLAFLESIEHALNFYSAKYYIKTSLEQYREKGKNMGLQRRR